MKLKSLAARWFEELWNQKKIGTIYELAHRDLYGVTEGGRIIGLNDFADNQFKPLLNAFPDFHVDIEKMAEDGDLVFTHWNVRATHLGDFLGIPPTGRKVAFSGMTWMRFVDGKIIEGADRFNLQGLATYLSAGKACQTVFAAQ